MPFQLAFVIGLPCQKTKDIWLVDQLRIIIFYFYSLLQSKGIPKLSWNPFKIQPMKNRLFLIFVFSLLFNKTVQAQTNPDLEKIDTYFEQMINDWDVPGASIGIVKDGKLVFTGNYGTKTVGQNIKPDENT